MSPTSRGPILDERAPAASAPRGRLSFALRAGKTLRSGGAGSGRPGPSWLLIVVLTAVAAVHAALFWVASFPEPRQLFGDEVMYLRKAGQMASGGDWSPGSFWPLLQARFLSVILWFGGGVVTVSVVQTLLLAAAAIVVGRLAVCLTGSTIAGCSAGLFVVLDPQMAAYAHYLWPEILHVLLFFGAWLLLLEYPKRLGMLAAAGFLLGLALLTKNHMVLFVPFLFLPALSTGGIGTRAVRGLVLAGTLGATVIMVNLAHSRPLAGGNQLVSSALFNTWIGLEDTSRRNFFEEKVPDAMREYRGSGETAAERNRFLRGRIADIVEERGLVNTVVGQLGRQPFRLFDRHSYLTDQLPGGPIAVNRGKGYRQASPRVAGFLRLTSYGIYTAVLVLSMIGMATLPPSARKRLGLVGAFVAYNLALFLIIHVKTRYRIQLMPVFYVYAGAAVAWLGTRLGCYAGDRALYSRPVSLSAWVIAAVGSAVLLGLAWGG